MSLINSFNALSNAESFIFNGVDYEFSHKINLDWDGRSCGFVFTSGSELLIISPDHGDDASEIVLAKMNANSYFSNRFLEAMFLNVFSRDSDDKHVEPMEDGIEIVVVHYHFGRIASTATEYKYAIQL